MTGGALTVVLFTLAGAAIGRLVGPVQVWLAGAGATGLILYTAAVLHAPLLATVVVVVVASLACVVARRRTGHTPRVRYPVLPTVLLAIPALTLLVVSAVTPLNDYDGRAFWLLKAKAIANEGQIDGPFFQGSTSVNPRNEYPLLVPLDGAVLMMAAGELDERHARDQKSVV